MKGNNLYFSNKRKKDSKRLYLIDNKCLNNLDLNSDVKSIQSYCHFPPIDKSIKKLAMQKPTSILNKFITKHAKDIINYTEKNINLPVKIKKSRNEDYKKEFISKRCKNEIT